MACDGRKTARYKVLAEKKGHRYQFFCDVSGALECTTRPVIGDTPEEELAIAWEQEGRKCFNMCHRCGKWVSDVMYNAETFECVECSPWEEEPVFCPHCGARADRGAVFCERCKKRLRYGNAM